MATTKSSITAGIICKNAASTLEKTLESIKWVDEIILLDDGSTDDSLDIAKKYSAKILKHHFTTFADKRNAILDNLTTDWIFYIDTDEIVSDSLQTEIISIINSDQPGVYSVTRDNYFLGKRMYPDHANRLFHRTCISKWQGSVHEGPIISVTPTPLVQPLVHHTHTSITSMLEKTNQWSELEADLRIQAKHPPVAWWRLIRIAATEWWHQFIHLKVGKYGREGRFEGYFQIIDKLIVYTKLWERQQ